MEPFESLQSILSLVGKNPCAIALPPRSRIIARGPDTLRFLNGQTSNQITKTTAEKAVPTCILSIKGKIISVPLCWRAEEPDTVILEVAEDLSETTLQRLERYLIADDVTLAADSSPATWHLIGEVWGSHLPHGRKGIRAIDRFGMPGWDLDAVDAPQIPGEEVRVLDPKQSMLLRIVKGIPDIGEIAAEVFPSEVGLDRTAVDFQKGCYLGQEVVSRLESVGQARRRMVAWASELAPPIGASVCSAPGERVLGQITTSLPLEGGGGVGLAIVRVELAQDARILHAFSSSHPPQDPNQTLPIKIILPENLHTP